MTNEDQIVALFARANPVPSLDLLDPVEALDTEHLAHVSARSSEMTEVETTELKPEGPSRRPRLALTVAMTVIALVALGILVNRESVVASPVSIANAFMDALAEHDGNAALELFSPDGTYVDENASNLPAVAEWDRAVGWRDINQECEEISTSAAGTLVACPFIRQTDWILALGLEPVTNNVYEILVDKGQIQSVVETDNGEVSHDGMFEASRTFQAWVVANHPDDVATMYGSGGQWLNDPAAIALYEQYTDEFVAYMESGDAPVSVAKAYVDAELESDYETMQDLLAPDSAIDIDLVRGHDEWERATGWVFINQGCLERSSGPSGTRVDCRYNMTNPWFEVLGLEPAVLGDVYLIDDGLIQSVTENPEVQDANIGEAWEAFRLWVSTNHPTDLGTMYGDLNALSTEALALWEQYTDEFVASDGG